MRKIALPLASAMILAGCVATSASAPAGTPSAVLPAPPPDPVADVVVGGDRPVTVHVPPGYDPSRPAPLLILLHGFDSPEPGWPKVQRGIGFLLSSAAYGLLYTSIGWRGLLWIGVLPALSIVYLSVKSRVLFTSACYDPGHAVRFPAQARQVRGAARGGGAVEGAAGAYAGADDRFTARADRRI